MHWLSFLIGALVGWLIGWLIDYLICRPRRAAAEAELRAKLVEGANREVVALKGQLAGHKDLQVRLDGANGEVNGLKAQLAGMKDVQANLDICRSQTKQYEFEIERLNVDLAAARAGVAGLGAAASLALPEKGNLEVGLEEPVTRAPEVIVPMAAPIPTPVAPDDLTIVEGIGPKIAELLHQNGIDAFAQLADASIERLQAILVSGGPRFRSADPGTWPHQALLARDGEWAALKTLQDALQGGRRA